MLSGGYGKEGKSYVGRTIALSAVLLWPLIFIMGKKADLPPGTVFDAYTDETKIVTLQTEGKQRSIPTIDLSGLFASYDVTIDYDSLTAQKKPKELPLTITYEAEKKSTYIQVVRVNGVNLEKPLIAETVTTEKNEDEIIVHVNVDLKKLVKHFSRGINRFHVKTTFADASSESQEVIFDVQF